MHITMNMTGIRTNVSSVYQLQKQPSPYITVCSSTDLWYSLSHPISLHSSGSAVTYASDSVTGIGPFPILSRSISDSIQDSPNPLPPADALVRARCIFKLATFSLRTRVHAGQRSCLGRGLEGLATDLPFIQEIRIQYYNSVIRLTSHLVLPQIFICFFLGMLMLRLLVLLTMV